MASPQEFVDEEAERERLRIAAVRVASSKERDAKRLADEMTDDARHNLITNFGYIEPEAERGGTPAHVQARAPSRSMAASSS